MNPATLQSRAQEALAIVVVGDGLLGVLQPRRHVSLWRKGPAPYQRAMTALNHRPGLTQLLSAVQLATGLWWASRQRPATPASPAADVHA